MSWSTSEIRMKLAPWNRLKPSSEMFYWSFKGGTSFADLLCFFSVLCLLCFCVRLCICALWSPAEEGLISWLSFVVCNCEFVTFPLVSWVRSGTRLYRFLIFAPLLTLTAVCDCGISWSYSLTIIHYQTYLENHSSCGTNTRWTEFKMNWIVLQRNTCPQSK